MINRDDFRKYIFITALVFLFALFSGYSTSMRFQEESAELVHGFFQSVDFTSEMSDFSIFLFIFLNNAIKSFLVILLGFFFSIVPILFIYTNGELIGLISGVLASERGLGKILLSILPHGIIEIPAMILAGGYGIWLGVCFYRRLFKKETFRGHFFFAMKKYLKVILPLIFIAAVIESFITPIVINLVFP